MRFVEHAVYLIRNWETRQGAYFEAFEVLEYQGQYIVYGEVRKDAVRVFRGLFPTPEKPVAFVVFPNARESESLKVTDICGGDALGISEVTVGLTVGNIKPLQAEELFLVNCNTALARVWGGTPWLTAPKRPNRDGLVHKCTRQIDLYLHWKRTGEWPAWFYEDRAKARAPVSRN